MPDCAFATDLVNLGFLKDAGDFYQHGVTALWHQVFSRMQEHTLGRDIDQLGENQFTVRQFNTCAPSHGNTRGSPEFYHAMTMGNMDFLSVLRKYYLY